MLLEPLLHHLKEPIVDGNYFLPINLDEEKFCNSKLEAYAYLVLRVANDDMDIHIRSSEKKALEAVARVQPTILPPPVIPAAAVRLKVRGIVNTSAPQTPKVVNPKIYIDSVR